MRYGRAVGIWIGAKRSHQAKKTCSYPDKWTDGNDFSYTNFLEDPNCRWPDQDCFHIFDNDHWIDAECQVSLSPILLIFLSFV